MTVSVMTEQKLMTGRGETGRMQVEAEARETEAGAEVAQRSSSPTLFLSRDLQR